MTMLNASALATSILDCLAAYDVESPDSTMSESADLCRALVRSCTPKNWDVDVWGSALGDVAAELGSTLVLDVETGVRTFELMSRFFDRAQCSEAHPAGGGKLIRNGATSHLVELALCERSIGFWLDRLALADRIEFWRTLRDWSVWRAALSALKTRRLVEQELVPLLVSLDEFSSGDLAAGEFWMLLGGWCETDREVTRAIVDGFLAGRADTQGLALATVASLIEIVARHDQDRVWASEVIRAIGEARFGALGGRLAVRLEFAAWPETTPFESRVAALVAKVATRPWEFRADGIGVLGQAARNDWAGVLPVLRKLIALPTGPMTQEGARSEGIALGQVLQRMAWGQEKVNSVGFAGTADVAKFASRLIPPNLAQNGWDAYLAQLAAEDASVCSTVLGEWLVGWGLSVFEDGREFSEVLPLLVDRVRKLDSTLLERWCLGWLTDADPDVWTMGVRAMASLRTTGEQDLGLDSLLLRVAARRRLGGPHSDSSDVRAVLQWAQRNDEVAHDLVDVLLRVALGRYPGALAEGVAEWREVAGIASVDSSLVRLERAIELRNDEFVQRRKLDEGLLVAPVRDAWTRVQERLLRNSMEASRASGRFALLALATPLPIARGRGTTSRMAGTEQDVSNDFAEFTHKMEFPAWDTYDPVGVRLVQGRLLHEASVLLSSVERA